ncbi:MAG: TonB-dependent receptor [Flavobacteriaceae bacterium]|nr:TonB-dependent receptor [Flavobacteriaceae bacterium]|tara:strand:+ start:11372 stop:13537 length:2166 start_codon:yes stop_codon:yes gene_type:complete
MKMTSNGNELPLMGANVLWEGTSVGSVSNKNGNFRISYDKSYKTLVVSYVGFSAQKIDVTNITKFLKIILQPTDVLDDIIIKGRKKTSATSYITSQNISIISSKELLKAACCNLSESFETNPSIDVNFSDAVSGTKQIKMLGLNSPYILITNENIPVVRGAAQVYGMSFIPGSWVESIQVTKGAGSVINGFESITGQINAELVKPLTDSKLFVNLYGSINGRLELNTHLNTRLDSNWSTGFYIHADNRNQTFDKNKDSFLDMPLGQQINVMNKWQYTNIKKGLISFINFRFLDDQKQTGEIDYNPSIHKFGSAVWGSEVDTKRFDFSAKFGYVNPEVPYQSLGFQLAYSHHDQAAYFGNRIYDINHKSVYTNLVYNSIISNTRNKIKTGITFSHDAYQEQVENNNFGRTENSIGGFFEYAFDNLENLNLTAGMRLDHHNLLGTFLTPRLHVRYTPWGKSALRFSIGRGKRSANIFAENQRIFASNRVVNIQNSNGVIYGLNPEIAWNYGFSMLQGFTLFERKADLIFDFYRTDFQNQVVVDYETPTEINFYNLNGESFASSLQIEFNYTPLERLDFKSAYKYYDVRTEYNIGELQKPLIPKQRFFTNISYETVSNKKGGLWKFDSTYNWTGQQRFSSTLLNPIAFQLLAYSPTFSTLNAQITKVFSNQFEIYVGGENITNVIQNNPILGSENPFGSNFDSTFVYGPIFGSMYYAGLRFKLN